MTADGTQTSPAAVLSPPSRCGGRCCRSCARSCAAGSRTRTEPTIWLPRSCSAFTRMWGPSTIRSGCRTGSSGSRGTRSSTSTGGRPGVANIDGDPAGRGGGGRGGARRGSGTLGVLASHTRRTTRRATGGGGDDRSRRDEPGRRRGAHRGVSLSGMKSRVQRGRRRLAGCSDSAARSLSTVEVCRWTMSLHRAAGALDVDPQRFGYSSGAAGALGGVLCCAAHGARRRCRGIRIGRIVVGDHVELPPSEWHVGAVTKLCPVWRDSRRPVRRLRSRGRRPGNVVGPSQRPRHRPLRPRGG